MPTIYVDGIITPEPGPGCISNPQFREQLLAVGNAPAIKVEINCEGGVCTEGMAMYSALRQYPGRKVGVVTGIAASMASVLLQACDERRVAKGALLMVHAARGGARNMTPSEMQAHADGMIKEQAALVDIYVARTGLPVDQVLSLMTGPDNYMTAEEAVALGFADAVEDFGARVSYPTAARLMRDSSPKLRAALRGMNLGTRAQTGTSKGNTMDPALLKKIMDVIASQDEGAALALLPEIITGVAAEEGGEPMPAEGDPAAATTEPPAVDPAAATLPTASAADAPATAMLLRITGAKTLADAEPILRSAITSARSVDADRNAVTMTRRRELIVELIEAGGETPATAWEGRPEDRKPAAHLVNMPIETMTARVTALRARNGASSGHTAPERGNVDVAAEVAKLLPHTLKAIRERGLTPEQFIAQRTKVAQRV